MSGVAADGGNDQFNGTAPHFDGRITVAGNDEYRQKINGFIKRQLAREFYNPETCLNMLRAKLNVVGLDFTINDSVKNVGDIEFPMTRHGGAFGTTPDHDLSTGFYNENGFDGNVPHTLKGNIAIGPGGGYVVEAEIVINEGEGT